MIWTQLAGSARSRRRGGAPGEVSLENPAVAGPPAAARTPTGTTERFAEVPYGCPDDEQVSSGQRLQVSSS